MPHGMNFEEMEEFLNAAADRDLGTVVSVLDGQGRYDEASALELCSLSYDVDRDNWSPQQVTATIHADPLLLDTIVEGIVEETSSVLDNLLGADFNLIGVRVAPTRVPATWREARIEARLSDVGPNNQASYRTLPENPPSRHNLKFHNQAEAAVYDALVRVQQRRPPEQTVAILPGPGVRVRARTFWPDFVVLHRGRAFSDRGGWASSRRPRRGRSEP